MALFPVSIAMNLSNIIRYSYYFIQVAESRVFHGCFFCTRFQPNLRFWPFGSSPKSLCNWNVRDWRVHPQSRDVFFGRPGMKTNSKNSLLLHSTSVLKVVGIDKKDHRALGEWGGRAGQGRVSFLSLDFDFFTSFMQITNERFRRAVQFCPSPSRIGLKLKVSRFGKLVYFHP